MSSIADHLRASVGHTEGREDALAHHGDELTETIANIEGAEGHDLWRADYQAVLDIEAGLDPA